MKPFTLFALAALMAAPAAADVSLVSHDVGQVTLNWQKFNEIWEQMKSMEKQLEDLRHPEDHPPVPFTLTKAVYQGQVQKHRVLINALFEVDVYEKKKWVQVPFLPSTVAIEEARLDGAPVGIIDEGESHQVLLRQAGRHVLNVRYALKSPKEEEVPELILATPTTPMTLVAIRFPKPHLNVTLEPSQGLQLETDGNSTLVTASVPPTSQVTVHWQKELAEEAEGPSKLYVDMGTLFTLSEASARGQWKLNYTILHRGVREIQIAVPPTWNVLSVNCDGLQEWKLLDTKDGPVMRIQLAYARKGNLALTIVTERSLGEKDQALELPHLRPIGVEREQGTIGLEARGSIELQVHESEGLSAIDPQELSRDLWNAATQPLLFAFRYTRPHTLTVAVKRHPEVPVLTTTVDSANAVTLITARGQMITRIRYEVRNNLKQFLAVRLPDGSELWSAFVSGQPVKPTRLENGAFRIPLAKSQIELQGQQGFPVELVYYTPIHRLLPVGYKSAMFPVPDAPVSQVLWSLYLPDKYRVVHFGGDMEEAGLGQALYSVTGQATMSRDEFDARDQKETGLKQKMGARLGNLMKTLSMQSERAALSQPSEPMVQEAVPVEAKKQMDMVADMVSSHNAPTVAGVFPVAFAIPASGQLFHFGQVMIVNENPTLSITYMDVWIMRGIVGMLITGLAWLFWALARPAFLRYSSLRHTLWPTMSTK